MIHVTCVMTWHPCHGLMHYHGSQCSGTYPNAIPMQMAHIPMFIDMIIYDYTNPMRVSQISRNGTRIPMHNTHLK